MPTETRTQRCYDHRLKELVRTTGNIDIALESGFPRSTACGWLNRSCAEVVRWMSMTLRRLISKQNTVILHSRQDDVVPFADSEELVANSGLPESALIEIGTDHRLADPEPLQAMLEACEGAIR
jgi:hypothetical protein